MKNNILILWLYLLVSWFLFFITSAGWTMWLFRLFGYGFLFILIGVILTFRYYKNKPTTPFYLKKQLIWVQITAILLNFGDCGDGNGSFNFFERVLSVNGWKDCKTPYFDQVFFENFAFTISRISFLIYVVVLIVFLIKQTRRK